VRAFIWVLCGGRRAATDPPRCVARLDQRAAGRELHKPAPGQWVRLWQQRDLRIHRLRK